MIRLALLWIALLVAVPAGAAAAADCVPFRDGWNDFGPCTRVDSSGARWVKVEHRRALSFDAHGIAAVWIEGVEGFYYVGRDGRMVPVVAYDNAPDAFVEGRARTRVDGRIGYIDRTLRVAIAPRYDWGFPFAHGRAVVCRGCAPKRDGGEHGLVEGGLWGMVDRNGREIVPLKYRSREELPK
ncbi:MAG TPA: WG repeat-containing protein [Xanthobacteraceae bacterium]|nr:WG repeat-containing protein [Xanthobacteraceae bacterium]